METLNPQERSNQWFFISLYAGRASWPRLIKDVIEPLCHQNDDGFCKNVVVHFGVHNGVRFGDYIGISCKIPRSGRRIFVSDITEYFNTKLGPPRPAGYSGLLPGSVYMKIPENSIFQDLHRFVPLQPLGDTTPAYLEFATASTRSILNFIGSVDPTNEMLFETALYFTILLLLSDDVSRMQFISNCKSLLSRKPEIHQQLDPYFSKHKKRLMAIKAMCLQIDTGTVKPGALSAWYNILNRYLAGEERYRTARVGAAMVLIRQQLIFDQPDHLTLNYIAFRLTEQ